MDVGLRFDSPAVFPGLARATHLRVAKGARIAAERLLARGKVLLRADVRGAGLGDRLANVWRAEIYPAHASARTHNPAVVFRVNDRAKTTREDSRGNMGTIASAADIIRAHTAGTLIQSRFGAFLAIPTRNVPRSGRRQMTPNEVENRFNQDLRFVRNGETVLAFVDAVPAKNGRGFRRASRRRLADGRKVERILMFVLVRQVGLRPRLRWPQIFRDLEAFWRETFPREIAAAVNAGSN